MDRQLGTLSQSNQRRSIGIGEFVENAAKPHVRIISFALGMNGD